MHHNRWIVSLTSVLALFALLLVTLPGRSFGAGAVATATPIASPTTAVTGEPGLAGRIDAKLSRVADIDRFNGVVLIAKDGEVILSKGYGIANRELDVPMTAQTKFRIGSLTALFTALATMRLVQEGAISLDDSICDYLDDCPEAWQPITIDHLLTRTSGLSPLESIPDSSAIRKAGATPQRLLAIYRDLPLLSTPGKRWNYSAMNDILLGIAIDSQGTSYSKAIQKTILDPLGMADTGLDNASRLLAGRADGYASASARANYVDIATMGAAGAMYSTVEDLYRLVQGVTGGVILSDTVAGQMSMPHINAPGFYGGADYGYGWFLNEFDGRRRLIGTGGIEGYMADLHLFPDDSVVVIVLGNRQDQDTYPMTELIEAWIFDGQ